MRDRWFYDPLNQAHRGVGGNAQDVDPTAEIDNGQARKSGKDVKAPTPSLDTIDAVDALLANHDEALREKLEAGKIDRHEYVYQTRRFDNETLVAMRAEEQSQKASTTPRSEDNTRPEVRPEATKDARANEISEKISRGGEVSEAMQSKIDRMLEAGTADELELREEHELGVAPTRSRTR